MITFLFVSAASAGPRADYERAWRNATRHVVAYRDMATALNARITWVDDAFAQAMTQERDRLLSSDAPWQARPPGTVQIVFTADSRLDHDLNFTGNEDWVVSAWGDGAQLPLVDCVPVDQPDPLQRALFPQIDRWADLWIARFETSTTPASLRVTIASGLGAVEASWP